MTTTTSASTHAPAHTLAITPAIESTHPFTADNNRRARRIAYRALAGVCVAACGVWAFLPLEPARVNVPEIATGTTAAPATARHALDLAAFSAPLWVAPPPPPKVAEAAPPPPPPVPLRWQLLAIVREESGYKALVYDPDTDKVLALGEGDESGPRRVARVTPTSMDVRDASGVRTIALREGGRP